MMRPVITILFFILFVLNAAGQNDPEAIKILDQFADNALKSPSVSMKFKLITTNQTDDTNDTLEGSVILNKDKYKLELPDNIVWFDGVTSWSYLLAEKEVTITKPGKKDNTFQSRPSLIFSMYKKDYKCRLVEEKSDSYIIDLYPENLKSELIRVRLTIGKSHFDLIRAEYKKKDGIISMLNVNEFNLKIKPDPDIFIYQPAKFKDVEVIDMR